MTFDSVLLPHDGSRLSGAVASTLAPLIDGATTVTLLHVRGDFECDDGAFLRTKSELEERGATVVRKEVDSEEAAGAILDVAEALRPALIAMTTHGRSGLERWVRGSVAERVLRASPAPVLMVNPFARDAAKISSILVPLDTSQHSARVLQTVIPLAKAFDARLTLLFVDWDDPTDTAEGRAARRAQRTDDIAGWLAEPRAEAEAAGLAVDLQIAHGDVADQILQRTEPGEHELLAMTTHGRSGPGRWVLGSVAEKVLRECRIPTLVVRSVSGESH